MVALEITMAALVIVTIGVMFVSEYSSGDSVMWTSVTAFMFLLSLLLLYANVRKVTGGSKKKKHSAR